MSERESGELVGRRELVDQSMAVIAVTASASATLNEFHSIRLQSTNHMMSVAERSLIT